MGYTGINMENVKSRNQSSILKLLNDAGPMSRKDIAAQLGLTPASVTTLCAELMAEGMLYEVGEIQESNRVGRRKVLLDIQYQYRYVLSICIETPVTCLSICDLHGEHCTTRQLHTDPDAAPGVFLKEIADMGKVLMWEAGIRRDQLLGAGVSVPGPVDRAAGVSLHAYRIWDQPVRVAEVLAEHLECPVILENNVKAFAQAELLYGMGKKHSNLVFLKWGPGVGSAIITDGHIYQGKCAKNAEIGHVRVDKNGAPCHCGRRGCLETRVAAHPLVKRLQAVCSPEATPLLWQAVDGELSRITVHTLPRLAELDDPGMWQALDDEIEALANVTGAILTMLAPDRLVVYGNMFRVPHFFEHFRAACKRYDPAYNEEYVVLSELASQIDHIGPLAIVASELFYQV